MALFVQENNISRGVYKQLLEVLKIADSITQVNILPQRKDALLQRLRAQIPLVRTHRETLKLDPSKTASRVKGEAEMVVCDIPETLQTLLSSEKIWKHVYTGRARLVDGEANEPWEARWYGESVRTGCGKCNVDQHGNAILPADIVEWACTDGTCMCQDNKYEKPHLGRVVWSGDDWRQGKSGTPLLVIEKVEKRRGLDIDIFEHTERMRNFILPRETEELVLVHGDNKEIKPTQVIGRLEDVFIDYDFDEDYEPRHIESRHLIRYAYHTQQKFFFSVNKKSPLRAELEIAQYSRQHFIKNFTGPNVLSLPLNFYCDEFGLFRCMRRSELGVYLYPLFLPQHLRCRKDAALTLTLGPFASTFSDVLNGLSHLTEAEKGIRMIIKGVMYMVCPFVAYITGDMPSQDKMSATKAHSALRPCRYCLIHIDERDNLHYDTFMNSRTHSVLMGQFREFDKQTTKKAKNDTAKEYGISDSIEHRQAILNLFPCLDMIRARPIDVPHSEYQGLAADVHEMIFSTSFLTETNINSLCAQYKTFMMPPSWPQLQSPKGGARSWRMQEYQRGMVVLPIILFRWLRDEHLRPSLRQAIHSNALKFLDWERIPEHHNLSPAKWVVVALWQFARSIMFLGGRQNSAQDLAMLEDIIIKGRKGVQFLATVLAEDQSIRAGVSESNKNAVETRKAAEVSATRTAPGVTQRQTRSSRARSRLPLPPLFPSGSAASSPAAQVPSPGLPTSPQTPDITTPSDLVPSSSSFVSRPPAPVPSSVGSSVMAASQLSRKSRRPPPPNPGEKIINYLRKTALPNVHQGIHLFQDRQEFGASHLTSVWHAEWKHM